MIQCDIPTKEKAALLKIFPQGVIAFDLETTGLSPLIDKIVEIAAVKITPQGVDIFSQLINPEIPIPEITTKIHGISDDMVKDKNLIGNTLPIFLQFVNNLPLIAHNAKFDLGFLVFQMHQLKIPFQDNKIYCSVHQARQTIDDSENYKLKTLAKFLDIDLVNHHRATDDALASLRIFAQSLHKSNLKVPKHLFNIKDFSLEKAIELPDQLALLYNCLPTQKEILIKYKGGSIKNQWRPIKPVSVLPMPQGSVLYAKCLLSDLYKSFSLKKISDVRGPQANEIESMIKT